jgi:hypothetical protein
MKKDDTDLRWQWLGRQLWTCFSERDSQKMQHAFVLGKSKVNIWDGGSYRELEFGGNMRMLPGRQPLRFALPPPSANMGGPVVEKKEPGKKASPMSLKELQEREAEMAAMKRNTTIGADLRKILIEPPEGFKAVTHPCFADLQRPRFTFRENTNEEDYQVFIWQRQLEQAEDSVEFVTMLSAIYAEMLEHGKFEIPIVGNCTQTMSALACALHMAGAFRCHEDPKFWRFHGKTADSQHKKRIKAAKRGKDNVPDLTMLPNRGSTAVSAGGFDATTSTNGGLQRSTSTPNGLNKSGTLPPLGFDTSGWGSPGAQSTKAMSASMSSFDLMRNQANETKAAAEKAPLGGHIRFNFRLKDSAQARTQSLWLTTAWNEWAAAAHTMAERDVHALPEQASKEEDEPPFKWLQVSNEPDARLLRIGGACESLWKARSLNDGVRKVTLLSHSGRGRPSHADMGEKTGKFEMRVEPGFSAFELAEMQVKKGRRVAGMLISSAETIGGGFMTGCLAGLEEDLCMRSDLHLFLREAAFTSERKNITNKQGCYCHIPEDGALLCNDVTMFRDGRETGYKPLATPLVIPAIICISLHNLNPFQSINCEDRVRLDSLKRNEYAADLKCKFEMMLQAASDTKVEVLTISDQGCEQLHNKGALLGKAFGSALVKTNVKPFKIILSGSSDFIANTKKTVCEAQTSYAR